MHIWFYFVFFFFLCLNGDGEFGDELVLFFCFLKKNRFWNMFLGKVVHQLFSFSGLALIISNIIVVELVSSSTQFFFFDPRKQALWVDFIFRGGTWKSVLSHRSWKYPRFPWAKLCSFYNNGVWEKVNATQWLKCLSRHPCWLLSCLLWTLWLLISFCALGYFCIEGSLQVITVVALISWQVHLFLNCFAVLTEKCIVSNHCYLTLSVNWKNQWLCVVLGFSGLRYTFVP